MFVLTHFPPNPAYYASHQMFGDAVRLPRFVLELNGSLTTLDTGEELKQRLLDPTGGALTVESDRPVIECLSLVAHHLRASLWFGVSAPDLLCCTLLQIVLQIVLPDRDLIKILTL